MDARMVLLTAVGSGLLVGMAAGTASPPVMKQAPEQPWEKMLRPDPPADPYAVAYTSAPQDYGPPNWLEPRVPVYAWEIEQYAEALAGSFYNDQSLGEYRAEAYPPLAVDLPRIEEVRAEITAMGEATREAHDAAATAAAIAAGVEAMSRRSGQDRTGTEAAAFALADAQDT
jgi:hypothetical protein